MKASSDKIAKSNSNSGHKNISYNNKFNVYAVNIMRNSQVFRAYTDSLECAIEIRDKVYDFFDDNDRLPSKEEMNITRRSYRDKIHVCNRCKREFHYSDKERYRSFKDRKDICGRCEKTTSVPLSAKKSVNNKCLLEEKYISLITRSSGRLYYSVKMTKIVIG